MTAVVGDEHPDDGADEREDDWRGRLDHADVEVEAEVGAILRGRSRELLGELVRPHRRPLAFSALLIGLSVLAELAGPWLVQQAIDRGVPPLIEDGDAGTLIGIVVAYLLAAALSSATYNWFLTVSGRVGEEVLLELRMRLFDQVQRLSISFHQRFTSGRVISRLTSDVEALSELLGQGLTSLLTAGLLILGIGVVLLVQDVKLALVALVAFPIVVAITAWFRRHSERAYRETREAVAGVIVHFTESLGGIRAVQAFRREARNQELFDALDERYRDANRWSSGLAAVFGPSVQAVGRVTTMVVLAVGGWQVTQGNVTVGTLAAFLLYLRRFFEPLQDLSQFTNLFQAASAALEKLALLLDERPSVAEPAIIDAVELAEPTPGELRLENVTFGYAGEPVLRDLNLVIPPGQTVALVGETGAGKTTVARLVARFWDPTAGRVLLDGVDLHLLADDRLRRAVAMVTQENVLFRGTVAENIAFGRPSATRAEIEDAARVIGADAFIRALPKGYDTPVQRRGGRLSAGQRQLVAFARAFLADPAVLILDEATSSLDIPSERAVQRALRTLLAERTAIIIAHRLTTVEIADRVLVIDDGRLVEDGSPAELIESGGAYADLRHAWADSLA